MSARLHPFNFWDDAGERFTFYASSVVEAEKYATAWAERHGRTLAPLREQRLESREENHR